VVDRDQEAISVSGPCPECDCDFQATIIEKDILAALADGFDWELKGPRQLVVRIDWTDTIRFEAFCYCTGPHVGRPSDVTHGCGAAGWLRDTPDPKPAG
jgi:hypothetical protein